MKSVSPYEDRSQVEILAERGLRLQLKGFGLLGREKKGGENSSAVHREKHENKSLGGRKRCAQKSKRGGPRVCKPPPEDDLYAVGGPVLKEEEEGTVARRGRDVYISHHHEGMQQKNRASL